MGLDMWIDKKSKGSRDWNEVAYWRKANAVRAFFVKECGGDPGDNGVRYKLTRPMLQKLRTTCLTLLQLAKHVSQDGGGQWTLDWDKAEHDEQTELFKSTADKLLPTQDGFFFGGTAYDAWYVSQLCNTVNQLSPILDGWKGDSDLHDDKLSRYTYMESW